MGSSTDYSWQSNNEAPAHNVTIAEPFFMGRYEVTVEQWTALMEFSIDDDQAPVGAVSWVDAQDFVDALNQHLIDTAQVPLTVRLPSEAEWEYACRAGTTTRFSFGDSDCDPTDDTNPCDLADYAWYAANAGFSGAQPIGQKLPNPFGLYDMHGNISEWVQDQWHVDYNGAPTDGSAWEGTMSDHRVLRGGSFELAPGGCRSAARQSASQYGKVSSQGFRLAADE
jgi:formylglycine-generating enzyme required for sulfatase activity